MSSVSMTEKQVGALHELAVAFTAAEVDVSPAAHSSLDVTVYSAAPDGDRLPVAAFSLSIAGTVRSRPSSVAT